MARNRILEAREALRRCGIPPGVDFFTLSSRQVEELVDEADRQGYRKPKNANGSRARYFHDRLQRKARGHGSTAEEVYEVVHGTRYIVGFGKRSNPC